MRKEYGSADCDATFTAASWANGSKALLTAEFTDAEAALPPGHYRIIIRHEDPAGLKNTYASSEIEVIEDHSESSSLSSPPSPGSEYWNKTEADSRYPKISDVLGKAYFDDFEAEDTANNTIAPAKSGQAYLINGSGAANLRRVNGRLQGASPRGTWYVWPTLPFVPSVVGVRYSMANNPGGSGNAIFALLLAADPGSITPMVHLTFSDSGCALERWPGPGSTGKTILYQHTYKTRLRTDGTPYRMEMRFFPAINQIQLFPSDGSGPIHVDFPDLPTYMSQNFAFEVIDTDTTPWHGRFDAAYAWERDETRHDWSAHARAESAQDNALHALFNRNTGLIDNAFLPNPPTVIWDSASLLHMTPSARLVINTFDMTGTTAKTSFLPAANEVPAGTLLRVIDATGTLFTGSQFCQLNVKTGSGNTLIGSNTTTTAYRLQGQSVALVSNGVDKWAIVEEAPAFLTALATIDLPSIAANSETTATITLTGARTSGRPAVSVGFQSALPDGIVLKQAWVSGTDTVSLRFRNTTGSAIDPASQEIRATVFKH